MAKMKKRIGTQQVSMRDAHRLLWKGGVEDHAKLTTGAVSTKQLRQMGHPFGRKVSGDVSTGVRGIQNGGSIGSRQRKKGNMVRKGVLMPLPINKQTGKLRRSFNKTPETGPDLTVDMGFKVPYSRFVLSPVGTRYMTTRGFYSVGKSTAALGAVAKRHRARKSVIINAARKKYLIP